MTKKEEEEMSSHKCALALGANQLEDGTYQKGDFIFPTANDFLEEMIARDNEPIQQAVEIELTAAMIYPHIHSPVPGTTPENYLRASASARNQAQKIIFGRK